MHDEHPDVQHESTDVDVRAILLSAAGLAAITVVSGLVVWLLFIVLTRTTDRASAVRNYPLAASQDNRLPPEPRLQTDPRQDLRDLRDQEDAALTGYRWVDRNAGVVRIPIEQAMKLTIERGLPTRRPAAGQGPGK